MKSFVEIRAIPALETLRLRQIVLRPGKPVLDCKFDGDNDRDSFHLGIFFHNRLSGIGSFMKMPNKLFEDVDQYRVRGMAVLPQFHKKGFGKKLLQTGEERIKALSPEALIWFNARETAIDFYKKFGYKTIGTTFDIPGVCTHIVMYKKL